MDTHSVGMREFPPHAFFFFTAQALGMSLTRARCSQLNTVKPAVPMYLGHARKDVVISVELGCNTHCSN